MIAHRNITVGAIIAILKAILVLGDATDFENNMDMDRDTSYGGGGMIFLFHLA